MPVGHRKLWLVGSLVLVVSVVVGVASAAGTQLRAHLIRAQAADTQQCAEPFSATRDPSNPLALAQAPGSNPLNGANFFVNGPAHGAAASTIATAVGINPASLPDDLSWSAFQSGQLATQLGADAANTSLTHEVTELSKIAAQPEVQRISAYVRGGGGPGAIFLQTQKILCKNLAADPNTVPILSTYFLIPAAGHCATPGKLRAAGGTFRRRVNEFADAVDHRPALVLVETDAIGESSCIKRHHALGVYESDLRYEINKVAGLPHTVVYVEGGYSDANSPSYTAKILNAVGVKHIRGFFTNDTHLNWTINEVNWATKVSRMTHGAHFIVNTAQNGNGPLLNRHPRKQGIENLCNPPGRALGPRPTTSTGFRLADAWLWTSPPGNSSGCGGGPAGGVFFLSRAVGLAERANGRLGPHFPNQPY